MEKVCSQDWDEFVFGDASGALGGGGGVTRAELMSTSSSEDVF